MVVEIVESPSQGPSENRTDSNFQTGSKALRRPGFRAGFRLLVCGSMKRGAVAVVVVVAMFLALGLSGISDLRAAEQPATDWLLEAQKAQAKGLALRAVELAGKAVEQAPKDPRGWYYRASLLEAAQRWDGAESDLTRVLELTPDDPVVLRQRGVVRLRLGRCEDAVGDFDRYAAKRPGRLAELWQRGIALYYVRRFDDARRQFELHRTVNPNDVENAAWHFACVARLSGFEQARQRVIPVEGDGRVPMKEIQALLEGKGGEDEVLAAAERVASPQRREEARFYARLYLGLYDEARGRLDLAARHLAEATRLAEGMGIMGAISRVHADWLAREIRRGR